MRLNPNIGVYKRALLSLQVNCKLKNKFWNLEQQFQQGKKIGSKGGSQNTKKQREARKTVGLYYVFNLNTKNHQKAR